MSKKKFGYPITKFVSTVKGANWWLEDELNKSKIPHTPISCIQVW